MAKSKTLFFIFFITLFSSFAAGEQPCFYESITPTSLGLKQEKLSHLQFFFHDTVSGPKPTAVRVAEAQKTKMSSTLFGEVEMADDPLTVGPEAESKVVGRAEGIYASASEEEVGLLMVFNFVFTQGKYKGSTLSLLGRNAVFSEVREMPIVGGSHAFRFARGYAQANTHSLNASTGDAVVHYNVYVFHY